MSQGHSPATPFRRDRRGSERIREDQIASVWSGDQSYHQKAVYLQSVGCVHCVQSLERRVLDDLLGGAYGAE